MWAPIFPLMNTKKNLLLVLLGVVALLVAGCSEDKSGETRVIPGEKRPPMANPGPPAGAKSAPAPATK